MFRRRLLAASAALLPTVGCVGEPPGTGEPTDTPDDATAPPGGSPTTDRPTPDGVEVASLGVVKNATYEATMGSGGVLAGPDRQFVVGVVRADRELDPEQFSLAVGDRTVAPGLPDGARGVHSAVAGREGVTLDGAWRPSVPGILAFTLSSPLDVDAARVRLDVPDGPTATWPVPDAARLAAPEPRFELVDLSVPETAPAGDPLPVSLTARNVSETDGRFLAAVSWPTRVADDDESRVVERSVAAGERVEASLSVETRDTRTDDGTARLRVAGHVDAERTVRVPGATTTPQAYVSSR